MKKVIKYILIVVLILFLTFLGFTLRRFLIIHKIENKLSEVSSKDNYYMKIINENSSINGYNETIFRSLGNKKISDSGKTIFVQLAPNEVYSFDNEKKVYIKSEIESILGNFENVLPYYFAMVVDNELSIIGQIKLALKTNIKEVNFRGIDCFAISFKWEEEELKYSSTIYIPKDSLLLLATETIQNGQNWTQTYEIQFDTQTDNDFNVGDLFQEYTDITPIN